MHATANAILVANYARHFICQAYAMPLKIGYRIALFVVVTMVFVLMFSSAFAPVGNAGPPPNTPGIEPGLVNILEAPLRALDLQKADPARGTYAQSQTGLF